jgi:hypothetical protein
VKSRVVLFAVVSLVVLLALGVSAQAKEGAVARLRAPIPADARPGTALTVAWSLVFPDQSGQPLNACGVFVQLQSAAGAAPSRGYADGGGCRAHLKGEYEATVIVPDGGVSAVEIGLSGTTDIFFPVISPAAPSTATPPAPRSEVPWNIAFVGVAVALIGAAALLMSRRRPLSTAR